MKRSAVLLLVNSHRRAIKVIAAQIKATKNSVLFNSEQSFLKGEEVQDAGEVIANIMLAYRHLEDASMRLGKAMQAADGGVSVYGKGTTVGAPELEDIITGAIFDLLGYLATQDVVAVGSSEHPGPVIDRFNAWCQLRGIENKAALVDHWHEHLPTAPKNEEAPPAADGPTPSTDLAPVGG